MSLSDLPSRFAISGSAGTAPHFLSVVCIAALALLAFPSGAVPQISPAAGSDAVLAMRSDMQAERALLVAADRWRLARAPLTRYRQQGVVRRELGSGREPAMWSTVGV